jgi:phenylalanyl-tRNA synthetase beta chain
MAVAISGFSIAPSPLWLQSYLSRVGIRPINNIVDITNFVMIATGQPLHAYDFNKIANGESKLELSIRKPNDNEELKLINGITIKLEESDILIANKERAIALGGIMGGYDSEVSDTTTVIVLECANFDMYSIRRSSMAHGIFSEAVTRFNKGQSPWQCPVVLAYAVDLIKQLCVGAEISSEVVDEKSNELVEIKEVSVSLDLVKIYLGFSLEEKTIIDLLNNVELNARIEDGRLTITPPFFRTDLNESEDIIEEIARLYGFDRLPKQLPHRSVVPPDINDLIVLRKEIRDTLAASGANELLTYSFVDQKLLTQSGQDFQQCFKLANALSPELQYYRNLLLPSILKKVHPNHKAGFDGFCLFEIGKTHQKNLIDKDGMPMEIERLALVISASAKMAKKSYEGPGYYQAKAYLDHILLSVGIDPEKVDFKILKDWNSVEPWKALAKIFLPERAAVISYDEQVIGLIGEFNPGLITSLKLPEFCAGFELDLNQLLSTKPNHNITYRQLSRFPKVVEDLTISVKADQSYQQVRGALLAKLVQFTKEDMNFSLQLKDIYQPETNKDNKSWTFKIEVSSYERTLIEQEVSGWIETVKKSFLN